MFKWIFAALLFADVLCLKAAQPTQDAYLLVYVKFHDGELLEKEGDYLGAVANFKVARAWLQKMHDTDPAWEQLLVLKRIKDCQDKVVELQPLATKQVVESNKGAVSERPSTSALYDNGVHLEEEHSYGNALSQFEAYLFILETMHHEDSMWEAPVIKDKIQQTQAKIDRLVTLAVQEQIDFQNKNSGRPIQ